MSLILSDDFGALHTTCIRSGPINNHDVSGHLGKPQCADLGKVGSGVEKLTFPKRALAQG